MPGFPQDEMGVSVQETESGAEAGGARRRGRSRGGEVRSTLPEQRPFAQPRRLTPTARVVSDDQLESIHLASLKILRDIGMDVLDAEAHQRYLAAGATAAMATDGSASTPTW